jgi:hypothetical protein
MKARPELLFPIGSRERYTLTQAALILGVSRARLSELLEARKLFAGWQGRESFVTDAELRRYLRARTVRK